ncbi:xanthine dehydrogenase accessory protein XdhC [Shimia haliotis]|uniref:Xanthine dehydrogenase accessory factor n=1 Tax=Shimia haliotis TaxID=1280847 RepID=A0A1I3ZWG9_9RHOB|nr:xanthine dehydrogenase accessory protein XdhC [Shimia haliotis]SFK48472.1 xanthine dehydrogenase accessory factor [Shimia haliotis]
MNVSEIIAFLGGEAPLVQVEITGIQGSSPREIGAVMFVSAAHMAGTIGGGQLEYMALDEARKLLKSRNLSSVMDVPLGPEIGQCCGGRVEVTLTVMDDQARTAAKARAAQDAANWPEVYVLGAGHVGRALAAQFQHLPVVCHLVDSRAEELDLSQADVAKCLTPLPESVVRAAPKGSAFVVLTHDHALDFLLASEALARGDAAYVGMIGSATKRTKFASFAKTQETVRAQDLVCPIGGASAGDKRPEVIAAFVVAEVLAALAVTTRETALTL